MGLELSHNRYISRWTLWGFGHQQTIGLYDKDTHKLEVIEANLLPQILRVLRKNKLLKEPIQVIYW